MTDTDAREAHDTDTDIDPDVPSTMTSRFYGEAPPAEIYYNEYIEGSPPVSYENLDEIELPDNSNIIRVEVTERYERGFSTPKLEREGMTWVKFALTVLLTVVGAALASALSGILVFSVILPTSVDFPFGPLFHLAYTVTIGYLTYRGARRIRDIYRLRAITELSPVTQNGATNRATNP